MAPSDLEKVGRRKCPRFMCDRRIWKSLSTTKREYRNPFRSGQQSANFCTRTCYYALRASYSEHYESVIKKHRQGFRRELLALQN